ncbi:phosphatase PAP2 family protein [Neorhizobium sp. JUb45]|uniref:phosphatase PAP2 family protein n=1 Tax=Neorhizobium sp. JUb45 TaxID=2485113 RepID=UPI00104EC514|nr:phosphatase PAP2 family protein [Neorhizobium sp. JUb45]TCR00462.1 undecaprenyl-diphosphatase [Neorhizobium sp. JUb45]
MMKSFYRQAPLHLLLPVLVGVAFLQRLASEVREGETLGFDTLGILLFRHADNLSIPVGPSWLQHAATDITSLGGVTVLSIITISAAVYLAILGRSREALFVFLSVLSGWVLSNALKWMVARPRPDIVSHLVSVNDLSFPSGHAMVSTVVYLSMAIVLARREPNRRARVFVFALAGLVIAMIGTTRVYLGVHYPTDVIAGWVGGLAWVSSCWMVAGRYIRQANGALPQ